MSRSLVSGVANAGGKESAANQVDQARLVTAVSGFPKAKSGYNIDNILKGQIGDDAYFVARHLDDWSSEQLTSSDREVLCPSGDRDPRTCSTSTPASGSSPNSGIHVGTSHRYVFKVVGSKFSFFLYVLLCAILITNVATLIQLQDPHGRRRHRGG